MVGALSEASEKMSKRSLCPIGKLSRRVTSCVNRPNWANRAGGRPARSRGSALGSKPPKSPPCAVKYVNSRGVILKAPATSAALKSSVYDFTTASSLVSPAPEKRRWGETTPCGVDRLAQLSCKKASPTATVQYSDRK